MRDRLLRRESKNRDSHPGDPPGGAPGRGGRSPAKSALPGLRWPGSTLSGTGASASGRWSTGGAGSRAETGPIRFIWRFYRRSDRAAPFTGRVTTAGTDPAVSAGRAAGGKVVVVVRPSETAVSFANLSPIPGLQYQRKTDYFIIRVQIFGVDLTIIIQSSSNPGFTTSTQSNLFRDLRPKIWHCFDNLRQSSPHNQIPDHTFSGVEGVRIHLAFLVFPRVVIVPSIRISWSRSLMKRRL